MFTLRDHRSGDLFGPWEYLGPKRRRLLDPSWAGVFRDYLLKQLPVGELATEFRQDVFALVECFRDAECKYLESYQLLRRFFEEQCEVTEVDELAVSVKPPSKKDCDGVINPANPDARFNKHRGTGYLVQIMETYDENDSEDAESPSIPKPDLITHVAVDLLTMHEKDTLTPPFGDTEQPGVKPQELLVDSHYGSTECIEKGRDRDVEIVSPAQTPKGKLQGKFTLEDFEFDIDGRITQWPGRRAAD